MFSNENSLRKKHLQLEVHQITCQYFYKRCDRCIQQSLEAVNIPSEPLHRDKLGLLSDPDGEPS